MRKLGNFPFSSHQANVLLFSVCWFAGLLIGTSFAVHADLSVFLRMRICSFQNVSIPGLLTAATFPFLLSACVVSASRREFILLISFCKAFTLAFFSALVNLTFDSAGWLIRFLLQFTSILTAPVFCWFCLRHLRNGKSKAFGRDLTGCFLFSALIVFTDYFAIAPLWDHIVMD